MPLHPIGYFEFKPTYKLDADDMGILDVHQCWLTKENSKLSWLKDVTSLSRLEGSAWTRPLSVPFLFHRQAGSSTWDSICNSRRDPLVLVLAAK